MVIVKATRDSEAGILPDEKLLTEMGKFNEELTKAGVMLAGEGLHPSSKGARVRFSGGKRTVVYGPFADQAEVEIRQVFESEDFGSALTPELREQEERQRAQAEKLRMAGRR